MAEYLNILMRRFTNVRLLRVNEYNADVEFVGWKMFRLHSLTGQVLEIDKCEPGGEPTKAAEWLEAILQRKVRDDKGNMIHG